MAIESRVGIVHIIASFLLGSSVRQFEDIAVNCADLLYLYNAPSLRGGASAWSAWPRHGRWRVQRTCS